METTSQYVDKCLESVDNDIIPWGCGMVIRDVPMSNYSWYKVLYVAVHLCLLDLSFTFRPFENHYEVHCRCMLLRRVFSKAYTSDVIESMLYCDRQNTN